jgi:predicted ArsR family transcriptional regulator
VPPHLARLGVAGLRVGERERRARGRPRDAWAVSPDAQPGGDPPTAYADLARWLVRSLVAGRVRLGDVEATGRRIGREIASADPAVPGEQRMHDALVALGFQPSREPAGPGRLTYRLRNCPYRDAVRERQPLVCGLHRGLTRGMLDAIDPATRLAGFVPRDPYEAGCEIELRGPLGD